MSVGVQRLTGSPSVFSTYGGPLNLDIGFKRSWLGRTGVLATDHLPQFKTGRLAGSVVSVDSFDDLYMILTEIDEAPDRLMLVESAEDFDCARRSDKFAITVCATYNTIGSDLSKLRFLRDFGVRLFSMSTNRRNLLADGVGERAAGGLSHLGVDVVHRLVELGIVIDVSHLSARSFWDVVEEADSSIIATHSNTQALCDNPRNLSDEQIQAIAATGGIVGVSTYPTLIASSDPSVEVLVSHIDHIVERVGAEHAAIGTDFVGFLGSLADAPLSRSDPTGKLYRRHTSGSASATPGIEGFGEVYRLVDALAEHGYSTDELAGILWRNFTRLLG